MKYKKITYPNICKNYYEISENGDVRNAITKKKLKKLYDKDGYELVTLYYTRPGHKEHKKAAFRVHRLVAWEYCPLKDGCNIVNHLDGVKTNNHYTNLEWTTPLGNTRHAIAMGLQTNSGPKCPSAIYDESVVRKICEFLEKGTPVLDIYYNFFPSDRYEKINHREFYQLIYSIMNGTRHLIISKEYNIDKEKCKSIKRKRFTDEDTKKIQKMLKDGFRPIEIMNQYGYLHIRDCRRLADKIRIEKKKLKIC